MSSLWMEEKRTIIIKKKKPSPANYGFLKKPLSPGNKNPYPFIKEIFLFSSGAGAAKSKGSMTIEAALLIPIFLFFFLHLSGAMEMLWLHGKLEAALWNAGNQLTLYADIFSETAEALPDVGISYLLVNNQVASYIGQDYLENSPLVYGAAGLNYLRSEYLNEEECLDVIVTYQVKPSLSIFPFPYRRMTNRYYGRVWTGYDVSLEKNRVRYAYMTPYGEVWHMIPQCSYIFHEVKSVSAGLVGKKKNAEGRIYEACEFCCDEKCGDYIYVTAGGEKYHYNRKCTAIFKEVIAVEWEEREKFRGCSRCVSGKTE